MLTWASHRHSNEKTFFLLCFVSIHLDFPMNKLQWALLANCCKLGFLWRQWLATIFFANSEYLFMKQLGSAYVIFHLAFETFFCFFALLSMSHTLPLSNWSAMLQANHKKSSKIQPNRMYISTHFFCFFIDLFSCIQSYHTKNSTEIWMNACYLKLFFTLDSVG